MSMKTFFEIVGNKTYRQLTSSQKEEIQNRQNQLVIDWQDETNELRKEEIFDELFASLSGLIKGMAYRQAEKSFSVEQEDFEGIMNLTLVETLLQFDRSLNKPCHPVFIMNVQNEIKMMYRQKGYDIHDTVSDRLEQPNEKDPSTTLVDVVQSPTDFAATVETSLFVDEVVHELFGEDEKKRTIVHMSVQGFKRNEIVSAIAEEGQSTDSVAKQINRTVKRFKEECVNLTDFALA
ncbi:hypothetical protein PVN23_21645 [Bacillus licheniformis]|uniref:hypothetical protein n=1 Tax=Bacillus licheniformis TaxID=1402 RepID=UPI00237CB2CD|nr:hypothetical protein [Bacillus licheniformis]MDE1381211.1 hypothetical protein [Bacillus licheniformis]